MCLTFLKWIIELKMDTIERSRSSGNIIKITVGLLAERDRLSVIEPVKVSVGREAVGRRFAPSLWNNRTCFSSGTRLVKWLRFGELFLLFSSCLWNSKSTVFLGFLSFTRRIESSFGCEFQMLVILVRMFGRLLQN